MSNRIQTALRLALALLVLTSIVASAGMGAMATADPGEQHLESVQEENEPATNETETEPEDESEPATGANLLVEQPSYIADDVDEQSEGGLPLYVVQGDVQQIYPQNFDAENVTDFGVSSTEGSLTYDSDFDRYTLDPEQNTGSFELYWVVEREVAEGNETVTETERYAAIVQVTDLTSVTVLSSEDASTLRDDAQEWRDWNATVTEVRESSVIGHMLSSPGDNADVMQSMVNAYMTTRSPTYLLEGGATATIIIMTTTLGGIFVFILLKAPDVLALRRLYKELFRRKSVEKAEGDLATRQEQLDVKDRFSKFANVDYQQLPSVTDHEAAEYRQVAETPMDLLAKFLHTFLPETFKENRVRAMGQCGYVAQLDGSLEGGADSEVATDGGASARLVEAEAVLEPGETVDDRDDLRRLTNPDERLLEAIPIDDRELVEFPMDTADYDLENLDADLETVSLPHIVDNFEFSKWGFEDDERIGEIIVEFVQYIYDHPMTDDEGRIDPVRYQLEHIFHVMQVADDRYQVPMVKWWKQHFERAIEEYDKDDELDSFLDDHRGRTDG